MNQAVYWSERAGEQGRAMDDAEDKLARWKGVTTLAFSMAAVMLIKGITTKSRVLAIVDDAGLAGSGIRIESSVFPEQRLALAYDF